MAASIGVFLEGRTAVITGGVSGIGRAALEGLLSAGCSRVFELDVNPSKEPLPAKATFIRCDVSSESSVSEALAQIPGDIHILVNAAGIARASRLVNKKGPHDFAMFQKVIAVNLTGTFNVSRLVAARMAKQEALPLAGVSPAVSALGSKERGVIINIASVAAFDGEGGQVAYSASKAGVVGMTLPMARDLRNFGIRVVTIAPGLVHTPMTGNAPKEMIDNFSQNILSPKRFAHADEVGHLIVSIVGSSYLNGETIRVDGGIRLSSL